MVSPAMDRTAKGKKPALKIPPASERTSLMKLSQRVFQTVSFSLLIISTIVEFSGWAVLGSAQAAEVILADQIAALQSPEQTSREMALSRMAQMGGRAREAVGAIVPLLKDPVEDVRMAAAQTLGRLGNPAEVSGPALLAALDDSSVSVRVAAIGSLRQLGWERPAVVQKLVGMATSESWLQRVAVAEGLMIARDLKEQPEAALAASAALVKLLADPYVLVRAAAARSLGASKVGTETAVPALIVAAGDADWRVRRDVASALGAFGERAAAANEVLVALLRDTDHETRLRAGQSLRSVNPTGAFDLMLAAAKDRNEDIRSTAIEALGRYGATEQVIAAMIGALKDGSADVRFRAVRALDAMGAGAKPALEALTLSVNDRHCIVREYACRALGRLGPEAISAVPVLIVASTDDWHGGTRKSALAALKAIQPVPVAAPAN
jgi:HEAT repeat protein